MPLYGELKGKKTVKEQHAGWTPLYSIVYVDGKTTRFSELE